MLTDQELQSLRNLGNEAEAAADEIVKLRADLAATESIAARVQAHADERLAAERERLLMLAKKRADYEASAAAHHAGRWHEAHENHLTRHAAMRDLIAALEAPNARVQRAGRASGPSAGTKC